MASSTLELATDSATLGYLAELGASLFLVLKNWLVVNFPAFLDWALKFILAPIGYCLVSLINSKLINGNIESILLTTKQIISATVARINQKEIDDIKTANGNKVPPEKIKELSEGCLKTVKSQLNDFSIKTLEIRFPNLDLTLENMIEEEVRLQKNS